MTLIIVSLFVPFVTLTLCFGVQVLIGTMPLPRTPSFDADGSSAVIIVPAHDEEAVIRATLGRLKCAAANRATILLVADNCTDQTAKIGRAHGINVIERSDLLQRGKGFALDFARDHLSVNPPDIVLIVDADCDIDAESIGRLIGSCAALRRPCQATYLQRPSVDASPRVQLSTFAFFIKNVVRQRALQRLAGSARLTGTGMAFPWHIFASAELATGNIVEDLKLGQELSEVGHGPIFVEEATIWSRAETDDNTISQRQRWEGGFLQNAARAGPRMVAKAFRSGSIQLLWSAIDTVIPPFSLLILLDFVALLAATVLTWVFLAQVWPLLCLCGALLFALLALACAWASGGSQFVSIRNLARAPLYVAWKLPMYIQFVRRGAPKEWVRTGR